jgi:hypothetical protein
MAASSLLVSRVVNNVLSLSLISAESGQVSAKQPFDGAFASLAWMVRKLLA